MSTQAFTDRVDSDFADIDHRFSELLGELDWLDAEDASLTQMAVRELRRNIRAYAFHDQPWDIGISADAGPSGLTVTLEDGGPEVALAYRDGRPDPAGSGDHRLRVLDRAFDEVSYARSSGRSQWVLRRRPHDVSGGTSPVA